MFLRTNFPNHKDHEIRCNNLNIYLLKFRSIFNVNRHSFDQILRLNEPFPFLSLGSWILHSG